MEADLVHPVSPLQEIAHPYVQQLLAFFESLRKLDVDIVVLMARKAVCLYDVLLRAGVAPLPQAIVSSRTLDLDLAPFVGRRVALVDDTVIIGSTLSSARDKLRAAGAVEVQVHAFLLDEDICQENALRPTNRPGRARSQDVLDFCAMEVRAFATNGRPYQVDFPASLPVCTSRRRRWTTSSRCWSGARTRRR